MVLGDSALDHWADIGHSPRPPSSWGRLQYIVVFQLQYICITILFHPESSYFSPFWFQNLQMSSPINVELAWPIEIAASVP